MAENAPEKKVVNMKRLYERDQQPVEGVIELYFNRGGSLEFQFKGPYKGLSKLETYTLWDGEITTLPYGIAKHLRTSTGVPVHEYIQGTNIHSGFGDGNDMKVTRYEKRFGFNPLSFIDMEDIATEKKIFKVEQAIK